MNHQSVSKTKPPIANLHTPNAMNTHPFAANIPLFRSLTDSERQAIARDCRTKQYQPGDIIFHEGDPGNVLYLIHSGQVRIFVNGLDGSETSVILFGRPGDMFGELAVIDGLPRSATAVALTPVTLHLISRDDFRRHMRQSPQLALNFMRELSLRVRYNTRQMDSLATQALSQRLARKLLQLAQDYGIASTGGVLLNTPLTQSDLASLVNASRESINKQLREFRRLGWVAIENGRILIQDPDALRAHTSQ
jgi:CRP/FNR family transcriptional regulator/CRP/FNR family cyclic AMP-dependent transcriptional regulator